MIRLKEIENIASRLGMLITILFADKRNVRRHRNYMENSVITSNLYLERLQSLLVRYKWKGTNKSVVAHIRTKVKY